VNAAASVAIRQASGSGPKSAWRKQAGVAAPWVSALLTGPVPAAGTSVAASGSGGSFQLSGLSGVAVRVAALLAWLATAASGGYVLARWLRAGGSLRVPAGPSSTAPSAVIAGHASLGLLGLVLWVVFMSTGWAAAAWAAVGLLAVVAGLGMGVLALGLPSPRPRPSQSLAPPAIRPPSGGTATLTASAAVRPAGARAASPVPVFVIAAHGLFAATVLLLVITATVGAG